MPPPAPPLPPGPRPGPMLRLTLPGPRRAPWTGLLALVLHVFVLGLLLWSREQGLLGWNPARAPGTLSLQPGGGGGGGGGSIREVALPAFRVPPAAAPETQAAVAPPPPEPVPAPEPVAEQVLAALQPAEAGVQGQPGADGGAGLGPGSGGGTGGGHGTGVGMGTGPGVGPGSGGEGGRATPPEPRQVILPPLDYPRQLRGRTVDVTFWVGVDGRAQRVAVEPEIEDRAFLRRFIEVMQSYRFRPARSPDGTPIPGTATVSVTF